MRKADRKIEAEKHFLEMEAKYSNEILLSVSNAKIFTNEDIITNDGKFIEPSIQLLMTTSEKLVKNTQNYVPDVSENATYSEIANTTLLNFASFKNPGGGFINGSIAQEEALCHSSTLYNVLSKKTEFYSYNREHLNDSIYEDRILYTPDIIFTKPSIMGERKCNVITCAAPNLTAARVKGRTEKEVLDAMRRRIRMILDVAMHYHTEKLILGAFGCGVFGNNAEKVAEIFSEEILKGISINEIYFPIPDSVNLKKFRKGLSKFADKLGYTGLC